MRVTWAYDRGGHRETHDVDVVDPEALEALLRGIHERGEAVAVTIYAEPTDDFDELPSGLQIGLGHPTHAFAVHIADDGGYLADPGVPDPPAAIRFDLGGVPTEYPAEHLRLRPDIAVQTAATYLRTGGGPPDRPRSG